MIRRHLNGTCSELLVSETGEWQYDDAAEHDPALDLFYRCRINLATIDDYIEAGKIAPADDAMRARAQLLRLIVDGKDDEARNLGRRFLAVATQNTLAMDVMDAQARGVQQRTQARSSRGLQAKGKSRDFAEAIERAIKSDPTQSNRKISDATGASEPTVRRYRKKVG